MSHMQEKQKKTLSLRYSFLLKSTQTNNQLLQIILKVCQWKNSKKRLIFGKDVDKTK